MLQLTRLLGRDDGVSNGSDRDRYLAAGVSAALSELLCTPTAAHCPLVQNRQQPITISGA
jgi:hypothetical protein